MELVEKLATANMERMRALYAPIYKWCELFETPREPGDEKTDFDGAFYRALDQIVRRPDFRIDELATVLGLHFTSTLEGAGCGDYFEEVIARAKIVREFVEVRGEVA